MIQLKSNQIDIVILVIDQLGIKHKGLKEELLDHLCCLLESKMSQGVSFEQSLKDSLTDFDTADLRQIEKEILKIKKNKRMKNVVFLAGFLLLFSTTFLLSQKEYVPDFRPLSAEHKVVSHFGIKMHPILKVKKKHEGVDIIAPLGTPVYAPADGKVEIADNKKETFGLHIQIKHGEEYQTFYSHLSELLVKEGDQVKKGDVIAKVGSTGLSTGPHLHYEIIKNGEKIDPIEYLNKE